jgi:predicted DNA-binding protein with PD1-like motif
MSIEVKRLKPGEDLLGGIEELVHGLRIRAGVLLSIVGSLTDAEIRFANQNETTKLKGPFEIVSGTGTVCDSGSHIHIAVSDSKGATVGGHLVYGCKVYTTAEIVVMNFSDQWIFERRQCELSGYKELYPIKASEIK